MHHTLLIYEISYTHISQGRQISIFVESIKIGESTEITINILDTDEKYFNDLISVCNEYYKLGLDKELDNYFLNKQKFPKIVLKANQFLLNVGRFGGAELKSIEEIRSLPRTGADGKQVLEHLH